MLIVPERLPGKTAGWFLYFVVLWAAWGGVARADSNLSARLKPMAPFPALSAAAKANGIPLAGMDPPPRTGALSPGDTVTALITWHEKGNRLTQWLIYIQADAETNQPSAEKAGPMVMYTSTGHKYEFASSPATLRVRTMGPFAEPNSRRKPPSVKDASASVSVNKSFLGIGLDEGAAAALRWGNLDRQRKQADTTFSFGVAEQPYPASEIASNLQQDAPLQLAPAEERALAGWIPALVSYFGTVQDTPNLSGILMKVLTLPSLWSIARNLGVTAEFGLSHSDVVSVSLPGWDLPAPSPVYALPMRVTLNGQRALTLTLIATAPRPPLLACGGIIGLLAENPKDKENYLTLQVISAHRGTGLAGK